jgi:deferrochelatase/peroxidase EfeB
MARRVPIAQRGPGQSYRPDRSPPSIFGVHQPGIATPLLDHVTFAAFDVAVATRAELGELLAACSAAAERLMRDRDDVTATLGLGPALFGARHGLAGARPLALSELPPFPGDALDAAWCGGEVCVQACAREAADARAAVRALLTAAGGALRLRWSQAGFIARRPDDDPDRTPRDLLGFKSGTRNLRRGRDLDRHVWVDAGDRTWMRGGTYLVVRRIRLALDAWRSLPVTEQERVIGRHRDSGAPLGAQREYDSVGLDGDVIAPDAHVRVSAPESNGGVALLRRSYSYDDGVDPTHGSRDAGLLFLAYQRDPRRQFVVLQRRLATQDALAPYACHVGSAVFAVPPGARRGGFVGDGLLAP